MKVVTCLKQVASRDTRFEIRPGGSGIQESDLTFEISECDEYALEEALQLKEEHSGEVVILTVGPPQADRVIRKGLAMGADRAILIQDDNGTLSSPYALAQALARVLEKEEFDLVLAGTQSDDQAYGQTGVILAELLGLCHATIVMEIEAAPGESRVKALREMESGWFQWVEMPLPAVLSIQAGISQVRFASLKGIMQAKKKELRKVPVDDLGLDLSATPQVEVLKLYFPEAHRKAELLEGASEEVVEKLLEKLRKEAKVI